MSLPAEDSLGRGVPELNACFGDIMTGPAVQAPGPVAGEGDELPDLPRLVLPFNRSGFSRLRSLIDVVNAPA